MTIRRILLALSFSGTLAAQTFIYMSDPQFGMHTKNATFEHETVNFEFAIATANRLKQEPATKLMVWRHPGRSAHVGEPIAEHDTQAIEKMAGYVTRNPLSLQRLVYLDRQQAVISRGSSTTRRWDGTSRPWTRWNGWREWRITSPTRGNTARSSTRMAP